MAVSSRTLSYNIRDPWGEDLTAPWLPRPKPKGLTRILLRHPRSFELIPLHRLERGNWGWHPGAYGAWAFCLGRWALLLR